MKLFRLPLLLALLSCLLSAAPAPGPSPMEPLAWLAGGTWSAALSKDPAGARIDLKVEWSSNHQALRFDSVWAKSEKVSPYTSGLYVYNAAKGKLGIVYMDSSGTLAQGDIAVEGTSYLNELTMTNADGTVDTVRVRLTKDSEDQFTNDITILKGGAWAPIAKVVYIRRKAS